MEGDQDGPVVPRSSRLPPANTYRTPVAGAPSHPHQLRAYSLPYTIYPNTRVQPTIMHI